MINQSNLCRGEIAEAKMRRRGWSVVGQSWKWIIEWVMGGEGEVWNRMMSWLRVDSLQEQPNSYKWDSRRINSRLAMAHFSLSIHINILFHLHSTTGTILVAASKMISCYPQAFRHVVWYDLIAHKGKLYSSSNKIISKFRVNTHFQQKENITTPEPRWSSKYLPTDKHIAVCN